MLEIFDQNPSSRVFHVDDECYVLYLGAHWDDYKPFLRVGTSAHLPSGLPAIVSTILVPDDLTGNPLEEMVSLAGDARGDTHYVGDIRTVNKLKKFLKLESIPVEGLKKATHETDDNSHVFVYSYRDGNLRVKYHKSEIFDLHRRERQDEHFIARAQRVKNEFGRGPFKLPGEVYQRPGFAVVSGTAYLVVRGEIAAVTLRDDYFAELAAVGIDPDRMATVHVDRAREAVVRFFKRCRAKGKIARVVTPDVEQTKALAGIFRENSLPKLQVRVVEGDGAGFAFHRFAVRTSSGGFAAELPDLNGPIVVGTGAGNPEPAIAVDPDSRVLTLGGHRRPLIEGCVYQLSGETLSRTAVFNRYLPEKNYPYRDLLSSDENTLIGQIAFHFTEVFAGRDPGKVLRSIKSIPLVREFGRGASPGPIAAVVLANTLEFIRFLGSADPKAGAAAEGLAAVLEKHRMRADEAPGMLPIVGEISYHDGVPYLFYRFATRITSDRYAHAQQVAAKIAAVPHFDFAAERARLAELVAGLANPEQMEEARLRRIAERAKPVQPAAETVDADAPETPASGAESGAAGGGKHGAVRGKSRADRRRGTSSSGNAWRWIVPVGVLVLLILAVGALLFTNTIPNRIFGPGPVATAAGSASDGTAPAADGTGTDETPADNGGATDAGNRNGSGGQDGSGAEAPTSDASDTAPAETVGEAGTSDAGSGDSELPQGWPLETLPAIRALEETPGVVITDDRVVGPGGIEITVMDIINLVNRIATENGYSPMHATDSVRPNPDWIFPNNVFVLPNGTRYTVVEGDTLWDITVRYMVARLGQDYAQYVRLTDEYQDGGTSDARRGDIRNELRSVGTESHSENFTRLVEKTLVEWRE